MKMIDFSKYEVDAKSYGGSDDKRNIFFDGKYYMVKISNQSKPKNSLQTSVSNNVVSEYIGCHIMQSIGIEAQNTLLGLWNDEVVVACEDFRPQGFELHEFSWYMQNVIPKDKIGRIPTYKQLYYTFDNCPFLQPVRQRGIERYWETIVCDALIGNFDRHKDNFGFLTNGKGDIRVAPIYDCGACLYPRLAEEKISFIISDKDEISKRIYEFPKVALNKNEKKNPEDRFTYLELLSTNYDKECTNALLRVYPRINMEEIYDIVDKTPFVSDERKHFYKTMLGYRKKLLLDYSYEKAIQLKKEPSVDDSLQSVLVRFIKSSEFSDDSENKEWAIINNQPNSLAVIKHNGTAVCTLYADNYGGIYVRSNDTQLTQTVVNIFNENGAKAFVDSINRSNNIGL